MFRLCCHPIDIIIIIIIIIFEGFYKGAYPEVPRLSITQYTLTFVVGPHYLL
jgi:hypothetical protein